MGANIILIGCFIHVFPNSRAIGDRLVRGPGFEVITQCVHVAIGANTGIPEKIPRTTDRISALNNRKIRTGAVALKPHGGADTRKASTDNDDVKLIAAQAIALWVFRYTHVLLP